MIWFVGGGFFGRLSEGVGGGGINWLWVARGEGDRGCGGWGGWSSIDEGGGGMYMSGDGSSGLFALLCFLRFFRGRGEAGGWEGIILAAWEIKNCDHASFALFPCRSNACGPFVVFSKHMGVMERRAVSSPPRRPLLSHRLGLRGAPTDFPPTLFTERGIP